VKPNTPDPSTSAARAALACHENVSAIAGAPRTLLERLLVTGGSKLITVVKDADGSVTGLTGSPRTRRTLWGLRPIGSGRRSTA
jgi:hypothetical protein